MQFQKWIPFFGVVLLLFLGVYISGVFDSKAIICTNKSGTFSNKFNVISGASRMKKFVPEGEEKLYNCNVIWTVDFRTSDSEGGTFGEYEYIYFFSVKPISKLRENGDSGRLNPYVKVLRPMKVNFIYIILYFIVLIVFSVASIPLFRKEKWDVEEKD